MPSLQTAPFTNFAGGLQLVDQASEYDTNLALDGLNVRHGRSGEVRTRAGSAELSTFSEAAPYDSAFYTEAAGNQRFLGSAGALLRAMNTAGTSVASSATTAPGPFSFAAYGDPNAERVYAVNGNDFAHWNGTSFTVNPTITFDGVAGRQSPRANCLAVTPWDNRLLAIGFDTVGRGPNGVLGSPSTVFYCEQGDPGIWKTTWRETLTPGDGEDFVAAAVWRDRIFIFKQTKFFVFHGSTSDGSGNPRLEYYSVDTGCGVGNMRAVAPGLDGVYFCDHRGIYRTTGNEPELVSSNLDPLFSGLIPPFYNGPLIDTAALETDASVTFCNERIHVGLPVASGRCSFVYDPRYDWWVFDQMPILCGTTWPNIDGERLVFGKYGSNKLWMHGGTMLGDGSVGEVPIPFDSHWQGAWQSFGTYGEKILHRMRLWGLGMVGVGVATDFGKPQRTKVVDLLPPIDSWGDGGDPLDAWSDGSNPADLWGGAEGYIDGWASGDWRGSVHSLRLSSIDGAPFAVQRVENHLAVPMSSQSDFVANQP